MPPCLGKGESGSCPKPRQVEASLAANSSLTPRIHSPIGQPSEARPAEGSLFGPGSCLQLPTTTITGQQAPGCAPALFCRSGCVLGGRLDARGWCGGRAAFDLADWTLRNQPSGGECEELGTMGATGQPAASISQANQRSPADPCGSMQN